MRDDLIDFLRRVHREATAAGIAVASLGDRVVSEATSWDFDAIARAELRMSATSGSIAVDVGTRDGMRLLGHLDALDDVSPHVLATEGWAENVPVAAKTLAGRGVEVREYDPEFDSRFPLDDDAASLLLVRHDIIDAREFARVLRPGGRLVTEQIDGDDAPELREWFGGDALYPELTLPHICADLTAAGFTIDETEASSVAMRVRDVASLVEYLAAAPWEVADFDVTDAADALRVLADVRPLIVTRRRFRVSATLR